MLPEWHRGDGEKTSVSSVSFVVRAQQVPVFRGGVDLIQSFQITERSANVLETKAMLRVAIRQASPQLMGRGPASRGRARSGVRRARRRRGCG